MSEVSSSSRTGAIIAFGFPLLVLALFLPALAGVILGLAMVSLLAEILGELRAIRELRENTNA